MGLRAKFPKSRQVFFLRALIFYLLCSGAVNVPATAQLSFSLTPQVIAGASAAPEETFMGGANLRAEAKLHSVAVFAEITRWLAVPNFCGSGECAYAIVAGAAGYGHHGTVEFGLRGAYGILTPGPVETWDRAFRIGPFVQRRGDARFRLRLDVTYENWRVAFLDADRFANPFCCRHGNLDAVVAGVGVNIRLK